MQIPEHIDTVLLERLRNGDRAAFTTIYDAYKRPLALRLLQLLRNETYAEELLQDLFMKVWENRTQVDPTRPFKAYLYRIATNMAYNFMQRAGRERIILNEIVRSSTELYEHVEADLLKKENKALIERMLDGLPPQCRQVFTVVKLDGLSHKEAAEQFGISTHTVNNHLQKATKYLKGYLTSPRGLPLMLMLYLFS